ncbi:transducin beta-like protein 2 [Tanacetum coccineum]
MDFSNSVVAFAYNDSSLVPLVKVMLEVERLYTPSVKTRQIVAMLGYGSILGGRVIRKIKRVTNDNSALKQVKELRLPEGHKDAINYMCFTPDMEIITASLDGTLRVLNIKGYKHGNFVATLGDEKKLKLWKAPAHP